MIEQLSDSGFTGGGTCDSSVLSNGKQLPVPVKKQALRDLPNENNVSTTKSIGNSTLPKEKVPASDPDKISGIKRPSSEVNPPPSLAAVNANGNLVYVRRKTEAEVGKISSSVTTSNNTDLHLSVKAAVSNERVQPSSTLNNPQPRQIEACKISRSSEPSLNSPAMPMNLANESPLPRPLKSDSIMPSVEDKSVLPQPVGNSGNTMSSAENKSPLPHLLGKSSNTMASSENKSSLPHPLGKSGNTMSATDNKFPSQPLRDSCNIISSAEKRSPLSPPAGNSGIVNSSVENRSPLPHSLGKPANIVSSVENNHIPSVSITTKLDFAKESNTKYSQHRHNQLPTSLRGLDRSAHEDFLQKLRTLSSVELSKLAFELETRSIQLSLEEAREMARVEMLNVMGKSTKPSKSPSPLP
ncbi:unnamed protein product [Rhodiola kirilowii]